MHTLVRYLVALCFTFSISHALANTTISPLSTPDHWMLLEYSSLKPNKVVISENRMKIDVNNSASPIIFPFESPQSLKSISLNIKVDGAIDLGDKIQGNKGADDFLFRLGVVYEGDQTLNFFQKAIAAKWVKQLFALAPKGTGVDHISFFNIFSDARLAGKERTHPASELMKEAFKDSLINGTRKQLRWYPNPDKRVLGLWISSDGDDTGSKYSVEISDLQLEQGDQR